MKARKPAGREKYPCDHCGGIVNVEWYELGRRCEDIASCAKREKARERVVKAAVRWYDDTPISSRIAWAVPEIKLARAVAALKKL